MSRASYPITLESRLTASMASLEWFLAIDGEPVYPRQVGVFTSTQTRPPEGLRLVLAQHAERVLP